MNIRNISLGKGSWCVNLTSQPACAYHLEIWACNRPVQGLLELHVKYWTEMMSKFEGMLQLYRPNYRKVYRITTNFVRYVFRIMNSRLFTNPSFSQNILHLIGHNVSFQFKVMLIETLDFDMSSRSIYK